MCSVGLRSASGNAWPDEVLDRIVGLGAECLSVIHFREQDDQGRERKLSPVVTEHPPPNRASAGEEVHIAPQGASMMASSEQKIGAIRSQFVNDMTNLFHRTPKALPERAVGGEGCFLMDSVDRAYLDGSGGAAVYCLGHSDHAVKAAVKRQLDGLALPIPASLIA